VQLGNGPLPCGVLFGLLAECVPNDTGATGILVDNPAKLYQFG